MTDNGNPRGAVQSAVILCPFLLYPAIDFVFRIGNGILAPILSLEFSLGPAELGLVGSVFFITFGLTQLPLGVALDRWGPRRVVATLLVIGIAG